MNRLLSLIFCNIFLSFLSKISTAADTIIRNQTIGDDQSLVSASGTFKLGFFNPGNSSKRFLGIWFNNIPPQTVVWVANGDNPVPDSSGILSISSNGNLVILSQTQGVIWSSNSSRTAKNPVVTLLDSGNLVLKEEESDNSETNFLWQSFDYPSDTLIAGMKLGLNLRSHMNWYLTSWKNRDDPSTGDFTYKVDPSGLAQLILRKGIEVQYRSGPWDGVRFGGDPELNANGVFNPIFIVNSDEVYYSFKNINDSEISRFVVTSSGSLDQLAWSNRRHEWINIITLKKDSCDTFAKCGAYGSCNINKSPFCSCLRGFEPKSPDDWAVLDWFSGCVPVTPTSCGIEEGFKKFSALKLPDESHIQGSTNLSRVECEAVCLRNCSCSAYAITEVSGCVVWYGELIDIREYIEGGQDLYIRMAKSEIGKCCYEFHGQSFNDSGKKKPVVIIAVISVIVGLLLLGSISWWIIWKKRAKRRENKLKIQENAKQDLELPFFDLGTIATATDNFANMIGKGGFGSVYKGELPSGQEIAVKRLSKDSGQGIEEFKNEVILIAKLQHRSLVKLLGCCVEGEERMLIYEYMPNKSLDSFIFATDQTRENALKWQKRFDIIVGIARGLLYLHQDSRLTIIHRDLKASNILLDIKMNPKISDFGIARIFRADQIEANTKRVVGTYGYMSPEYAIDGIFSMKSDVYSFGVILLEIVSGKKNRGFVHPDHDFNLLGHAWKLWYDGKALEVVDELMKESFPMSEVLRCIQVGLLCVQHHPKDRPTMSSVVSMLGSEIVPLPQPKKPGFHTERFMVDNDSSSTSKISYTSNDVTVTLLDGR